MVGELKLGNACCRMLTWQPRWAAVNAFMKLHLVAFIVARDVYDCGMQALCSSGLISHSSIVNSRRALCKRATVGHTLARASCC
jgi:hypothetical protein